jgi:hypothetical protein
MNTFSKRALVALIVVGMAGSAVAGPRLDNIKKNTKEFFTTKEGFQKPFKASWTFTKDDVYGAHKVRTIGYGAGVVVNAGLAIAAKVECSKAGLGLTKTVAGIMKSFVTANGSAIKASFAKTPVTVVFAGTLLGETAVATADVAQHYGRIAMKRAGLNVNFDAEGKLAGIAEVEVEGSENIPAVTVEDQVDEINEKVEELNPSEV